MAWYHTGPELIVNGSFEDGPTGVATDVTLVSLEEGQGIPGWTVYGDPGPIVAWLRNGNGTGVRTPAGNCFLDLTGYKDNPAESPGGVRQTGIVVVPNRRYELTALIGSSDRTPEKMAPVTARAIVLDRGGGAAVIQDLWNTAYGVAGAATDHWIARSFDFVPRSSPIEISFEGIGGKELIGLDDVSLRSVNPLAYAVVQIVRRVRSLLAGIAKGAAGSQATSAAFSRGRRT